MNFKVSKKQNLSTSKQLPDDAFNAGFRSLRAKLVSPTNPRPDISCHVATLVYVVGKKLENDKIYIYQICEQDYGTLKE